MRKHSIKRIVLTKQQIAIVTVLILLLGAWLRLRDIGADPFGDDQERITSMALNLIHGDAWELLGPRMSTGSLKHSPFTIYLYALPFLLDNDPHIARIFTAFVNIVGLAVVHVIGIRYFGRITALLAILFLATNPAAVHSSRFIFNPNLAAPFVMLFVLFTLRGYYDDKPAYRLAHLPMLSLAGQCHPSLFLLAPVALIAWSHAWRHLTGSRQHLLIHTFLSGILALTLMAPWGIGLYQHISALTFIKPTATASASEWQLSTNQVFAALSGSFGVYAQDEPSLPIVGYITFFASAWLLVRGALRQDGLPGLLAVLSFFVLPTIVMVIDSDFMQSMSTTLLAAHGVERNWWIWPLMGNAALIQAAFFGGVVMSRPTHGPFSWFWDWSGLLQTRYLRHASILAIIAASTIIIRAHLHFDYRQDTGVWSLYKGQNTLDDSTDALKYARDLALRENKELMILASDPPLQTDLCVNCRNWEALMFTKEHDIRVLWDEYGVPIPRNGAILLAPFNYSARPLVFSGGDTIFTWYRVAQLPPAEHFKPNLPLLQPVHFSNGATVLGFLRNNENNMPAPGTTWVTHMLWRVDNPNPEYYKLFAHLIDNNGVRAQVDPPGMIPGQQYAGEHILSQLEFQIADDLPPSGPLFIRFGMYNQNGHADIIDATVEYPDQVQIRGSNKTLVELGNGLLLDSFTMKKNLPQGPPLNIQATWLTPKEGARAEQLRLNWQLESPDNFLIFDQTTDLLPTSHIDHLPGNMLITANYALRIPTDLLPGRHRLSVTLTDSTKHSPELHFTDFIDITPRRRQFHPPTMQNSLRVTFADQIRLSGYDFEHSDEKLKLTLHWHALGQIPVDYKYFIHVSRDGEVVTQLDAMPDYYRYPTSWWAQHEFFSDTVELELSNTNAEEIRVTLGLYNAQTGQRLSIVTADGSKLSTDSITLLPVAQK